MVSFPQLFIAKDRNFSGQKKGCTVYIGVDGRENKKAEKNKKQRSEEKNRNCSAKKVQILAYAHAPM